MYEHKGSTNKVTYCRLEHLENDWSSFLGKKISCPKLNAMSGVNSVFGNVKEPRQKNYMSYYDDDLIDLIIDKEKDYIKKFSYDNDIKT
jgi:hypothetical protein